MRKLLDTERQAAERLLDAHRLTEDTDTDAQGDRVIVQFCQSCDNDWPCDTSLVAEGLLEFAAAAQGAMSDD